MFWIFFLLIILMAVGCYVAYKEAKHHELHKMRACFSDIEKHIRNLEILSEAENDMEAAEMFRGEVLGLDRAIEELDKEDANCDLIQEIKDDLAKIKEKVASLFNK